MWERLMSYLRGSLVVQIYGLNPESYLVLCAAAGLTITDLRRTGNCYTGTLSLTDFRRSLPLARRSRTLLHIVRKSGLPFSLYRGRKRKAYAAGLLTGLGLWFFLSFFLWDIQVEGNRYYTEDILLTFLKEQQITHGMPMSGIVCDELEQALRMEYPRITWVSAQISGTRLLLHIKENSAPMEIPEADDTPCDLIASADGIITSIVTRSGVPLVKAGDTVTAGQVLVSGRVPIHNDAGEVAGWNEVTADADIQGLTVLPYHWKTSVLREERELLNRRPCGITLVIGSRSFSLGRHTAQNPGHLSFSEYWQPTLFYNRRLPFSFCLTWDRTFQTRVRRMTESEQTQAAEEAFQEYQTELEAEQMQIRESDLTCQADALWLTVDGTVTVETGLAQKNPLPALDSAEESVDADE